jgi:CHAT domain-containing protein
LSVLKFHPADKAPLDARTAAFASLLIGLCKTYVLQASALDEGLLQINAVCLELQHIDGAGSDSSLTCLSILAALAIHGHRQHVAILYLRRLIEEAESARRALFFDPSQRSFWQAKWIGKLSGLSGYATLARLLAEEGDTIQALDVSELTRNRAVDEVVVSAPNENESLEGSPLAVDSKLSNIDERLSRTSDIVERVELECERSLLNSSASKHGRAGLTGFTHSLLGKEGGRGYDLSHIPDDAAIVSIHHSDDEWWSIVATKARGLRFLRFERGSEIGALTRAWLSSTKGLPLKAWKMMDGTVSIGFYRPRFSKDSFLSTNELENRLQAILVEPLVDAVRGARTITIVADDDLLDVPFGALRYAGKYLVERFDFSYAPSVALAIASASIKSQQDWRFDLFAIADERDRFGQTPLDFGDASASQALRWLTSLYIEGAHGLRYARLEVEDIASNFPEDSVLAFRDGGEGRRAIFAASADGSLRSFKYVHLTAHVSDAPGSSGERFLAIGDGITATELSHLRMGSELIVLSGCGTAIGPYLPGQGVLGLGIAALMAGNASAVLTLWEIPDDLSERFMKAFYKLLASGSAPYKALSSVQRDFAESQDRRMRDPKVWGAFILFGQI